LFLFLLVERLVGIWVLGVESCAADFV